MFCVTISLNLPDKFTQNIIDNMQQNINKISEIEYNTFLKFIDENELDIFSTNELRKYTNLPVNNLQQVLELLVKKQFLLRLENGRFVKHTFKNEYVIGNFLTNDATIAYWSALNIHGLTEQFPNKVYVQTTKRKANKEILGIHYQFVKVSPKKMTGIIKSGIGTNQFRITDVEKTIFDCFDLVKYSGGFMELIRALKRTKLNSKIMMEYAEIINNNAATKRIGYLAELFNKKEMNQFINYSKKQKSKNFDLLDVFGYNDGKYISDWNLRLNIDEESLINIANSIY